VAAGVLHRQFGLADTSHPHESRDCHRPVFGTEGRVDARQVVVVTDEGARALAIEYPDCFTD